MLVYSDCNGDIYLCADKYLVIQTNGLEWEASSWEEAFGYLGLF